MCAQRFGLGFNAVYHLTDVPSFVSGDHIVMFDPHARYLPGISPAQPGLKIAFERGNLVTQVSPLHVIPGPRSSPFTWPWQVPQQP